MKKMDDQLKKELLKILVDRLLIGCLLVFAGLFANYLIEKYKFEEGFRTELNKTRVARIGEVWENLYVYEAAVDNLLDHFRNIVVESKSEEEELRRRKKELPPLIKSHEQALTQFIVAKLKNRFWIDEDSYSDITEYSNVLSELIDAYLKYDVKKIKELDKKRTELRQGVRNVRDKLLGEGKKLRSSTTAKVSQ